MLRRAGGWCGHSKSISLAELVAREDSEMRGGLASGLPPSHTWLLKTRCGPAQLSGVEKQRWGCWSRGEGYRNNLRW